MLEGRLGAQGLELTGEEGDELGPSSGEECPAGRREEEDKNTGEETALP